jgi:hypothetical protein
MTTPISARISLFMEAYLLNGGPRSFCIDGEENVDVEQLLTQAAVMARRAEKKPAPVSAPSSPASQPSVAPASPGFGDPQ